MAAYAFNIKRGSSSGKKDADLANFFVEKKREKGRRVSSLLRWKG